MKHLWSVVLCAFLLLAVSLGAAVALPIAPEGYIVTGVGTGNNRAKPGGTINIGLRIICHASNDVVGMDMGGSLVGPEGAPVPVLAPANPLDVIRPGNEVICNIATFDLPKDAIPGTVYTYTLNHYTAAFSSDFSKIWNSKLWVWESNSAGYVTNIPLPRYDQMMDYALQMGPVPLYVTVTPEPASAIALLTGLGTITALFLKRRI